MLDNEEAEMDEAKKFSTFRGLWPGGQKAKDVSQDLVWGKGGWKEEREGEKIY